MVKNASKKLGAMIRVIILAMLFGSSGTLIHAQCPVTVAPSQVAVSCSGPIQFTASGGTNYVWYYGTPSTPVGTGATYLATTTGTYYLQATGSCGGEQWLILSAAISTTPVTPSVSNKTVLYNTGTVFQPDNANLLPAGETYRWYASNQTTLLATGLEFYTGPLTLPLSYYVSRFNGVCESAKDFFTTSIIGLMASNAGADVNVNLPVSTATLTGSYSGPVATIKWLQVSGPSVTMSGTTTTTLTLSNITAGSYVFRFQVNDEYGQSNYDDVVFEAIPSSPTNNYNYTREETILVPGITSVSQASALPVEQKQMVTTYQDDLGRPMESVGWQSSPGKYDGVQPVFYDALGREAKRYLGTVSTQTGNGQYKKTLNASGDYSGVEVQNLYTDQPYAVTVFESSPLGRVVEQGSEGQAWQPGAANGTTLISYGTNAASVMRQWTINTSTVPTGVPNSSATWAAAKLNVKTVTSFTTVTETYADMLGQKLLERVKVDASNWAETYYVYDVKGNLRFVVPPALSKELKDAANYNATQAQTDRWCYQNIYDNLNRVVESKSPGAGWVYMVYDKRDRLILQQDALQRQSNVWEFKKYDDLNRVVMSGLYRPATPPTRAQLQATVDGLDFGRGVVSTVGFSYEVSEIRTGTDIVSSVYDGYREYQATTSISLKPGFSYSGASGSFAASIGDGQTQWDIAFPDKNVENLQVTYYDNYTGNPDLFGNAAYQFSNENFVSAGGEAFSKYDRVRGKTMGTMVKVLGGNQWLKSVTYYDEKQRTLQTISSNHLGYVERESALYDYSGKVLERHRSSRGSYAVEWKELLNLVVESSGTILRKSGGTTAWGDGGASSVNELPAGEDGWVETTAQETNKARMFGLSENNIDGHYNTINYAIYLNATSQVLVYEKGSSRITALHYDIGDKFLIERVGTTIYYKQNGSVIHQSTVPSTTRLIVDCAFYTVDGKLHNTYASFGSLSKSPLIVQRYTYDHAGRMLKTYEKFNAQPEIIVSSYEYDELGQLKDEKLHSADNGSTYLQSVDYSYNVKGWLTKANSASGSDAGETDYFGYELAYETDAFTASSSPRKDGTITAAKWRNDLGARQRLYTYQYTSLNQLSGASYKAGIATPWSGQPNYYTENSITYDYNGNIKTLKRNQKVTDYDQQELIDDLGYTYSATSGNQLMSVTEGSTAAGKTRGFNDGNLSGDDYVYDVNGNLTVDRNKGIAGIIYNELNLQKRITFSDNTYMQYTYAATGVKLTQTYYNASDQPLVKTDYVGSQVFVNDEPVVMFHSEGRLLPPAYSNLIANKEANGTNGFAANLNVTLTSVTQANETYVKVVSNQSTGTPGVLLGTYNVKAGEHYSFKVLGYRDTSHPAYLLIKPQSGSNVVWMSALLPQGSANENWTTVDFIVPAGVTQITPGVLISAPAVGATFYVNRVALYKVDWEYQYFLTDQLGSTRAVLSTTPSTLNYRATFETEHQVSGANNNFLNVNTSKITVYPSNTTVGGDEVITMDNTYRIGPGRSLKVYPGDQVDASVSAYYAAATGLTPTPAATMASALISVMSGGGVTPFDGAAIQAAYTNSENSVTGFSLSPDNGSTRPSAFLNYILFDENYVTLEAKSVPVGSTAGVTHTISFSAAFGVVSVKQPGYMFVYLSYDNESTHPVYFDELKIDHIESPLVQVNDYYPYGMTSYSWVRDGELENRYLYQGKELDVKTGFQDFQARQYDPVLGRWFASDPKGSVMPYNSTYASMMNNPVMYMDPDGECPICVVAAIGAVIGGVTSGTQAWVNNQDVGEAIWKGGLVGAASAVVTAGLGPSLFGSIVTGVVSGGLGAALNGGDIAAGIWQGALGGAVGGIASINVPGIIPGMLVGAATGGLASGITAELTGGRFKDGFINGAIAGGITGGIYGGVAAAWSRYERNILFGGVTRSGKQQFLNDLANSSDAYDKGLNNVILGRYSDFDRSENAVTKAIVNGNEVNFSEYTRLLPGAGTRANIYVKPASLRQMTSTFGHEMVHVSDIYSGYGRIVALNLMIKYRTSYNGIDWERYNAHMKGHFEYRAYQSNINHGYRVDVYRNELLKWAPYAGF